MKKIPDYCDERARKFFRRGFDGSPEGIIYFDTDHELLRETKTLNGEICCYCGNRALAIQANLRSKNRLHIPKSDYDVTGWTCCCKSAMDEYDFQDQVKALEARHRAEFMELLDAAPTQNQEVIQKYVERVLADNQERVVSDLIREGRSDGLKRIILEVTGHKVRSR